MAIVLAEPTAHYQLSGATTEPASVNDNLVSTWFCDTGFVDTSGRFGGRALGWTNTGALTVRTPSGYLEDTIIIGGWFKWDPSAGSLSARKNFLASRDFNITGFNWSIQITAVGNLAICGAGATTTGPILDMIANPFTAGVWHYVEVKVFHNDTTGTMVIKIDGVQIYSTSGRDFQDDANATTVGGIGFGSQEASLAWEDIIIMDSTGAANNDFIGELRYEISPVNGDGTTANWTASAGSNYQTIDDPAGSPDDVDYISSATTDQDNYSTHATVSAPNATQIVFAELIVRTTADAAGEKIALQVDSGGTINRGPDLPLVNATTRYRKHIWETDPNTGVAWTLSGINASQFGVRKRV